jgi:folate-dependent phosphoribosylglycinamide formyltransferase PurN
MIRGKKWAALFSHTGSEIVNISNKLSRSPDVVITNNVPGDEDINKEILKKKLVYTDKKPTVESYRALLEDADIVTLHGWMRIIPKEICKEYNIYNLHPGLITKYPELKGADPQKQVATCLDNRYNRIGCVIHKVIPEVDEGRVLLESSTANHYYSEEEISCQLHKMALSLWLELLHN